MITQSEENRDSVTPAEELKLELYKRLKEESRVYLEKLPGFWLQKFILLGATAAFILTQDLGAKILSFPYTLALLLVPALAIFLDTKLAEFGLHSRVVSGFIQIHFSEVAPVVQWELLFWGLEGPEPLTKLSKLRSFLGTSAIVIPTYIVIMICFSALDQVIAAPAIPAFTLLGIGVCIVYTVVVIWMWFKMFSKSSDIYEAGKSAAQATKPKETSRECYERHVQGEHGP